MKLPLLLALSLALPLAGCVQGGEDGGTTPTPDAGAIVRNETTSIDISVQAGSAAQPGSPNGAAGEVTVEENATTLLVEAQWDCASPTCGFTLVVLDPAGEEVGRAEGDGSATLEVTNVTNGTYAVQLLHGEPVVVQAQGEIRATVFYGPMPAGFTAFEEEAARRSGP